MIEFRDEKLEFVKFLLHRGFVSAVEHKAASGAGGTVCDKEGPAAALFSTSRIWAGVWFGHKIKKRGNEAVFPYFFSNIVNGP